MACNLKLLNVISHCCPDYTICNDWFTLNPNKGKIRVVFDCGFQCRGISVNENLLSGPDLTNQLVGALIRFWVGPVAFMVNIQVIVYQVIIPENQRSSLTFVWWNEGNLDSERANYEMCVHLFRAVFSLSSNNYALRKVAVDNIDETTLMQ